MATLSDYLNNATFGLFAPKKVEAQSTTNPYPGIFPVPTPNPLAQPGTGAGYPTTNAYTQSGTTTGTSWDAARYPTGSNQGTLNQQAIITKNTANATPTQLNSNTPIDSTQALINKLMQSGYNETDARNAANGPNADNLKREYLSTSDSGGITAPAPLQLKSTGDLLSNIDVGTNNPVSPDMEDYFQQLKDAAAAGDQAAIDQLNQVYGQQAVTLNSQLSQTDTDKALAEQELATQLKGIQNDIGSQKTKVQESVMTESEKAAEAARSAQRQNRNIMRALGILGSTYAAEALQNPMNELAKQKATFAKWGMDQISTLDQTLLQKQDEANVQKNKILSQYASIKEKIQQDIRYNEQQKATSLAALKAGAQQNLAQIQGQMVNYQQQLEQQKLAFTTQIAQIMLNKNPGADIGSIMAQAQKTTGQMFPASQQVATVGATPSRQTLSGFNMANYPGWGQEAAYEDWKKKQGL